MECPECGVWIEDGRASCPVCGTDTGVGGKKQQDEGVQNRDPAKDLPEDKESDGFSSFWDVFAGFVNKPQETMRWEMGKGNFTDAVRRLLGVFFVSGIIYILVLSLAGFSLIASGLVAVAVVVFGVVFSILWVAAQYGLSRILGGKGTFDTHAHIFSLLAVFGFVVNLVPALLAAFVPMASSIIMLGAGLYLLYLQVVFVHVVHGIDYTRSAVVVLGMYCVLLVLYIFGALAVLGLL